MKTIDQYRSLLERALIEAGLKTSLANKQKLAHAIIDADRSQLTGAKAELWDIMLGGGEPESGTPAWVVKWPGAQSIECEYYPGKSAIMAVVRMDQTKRFATVNFKGKQREATNLAPIGGGWRLYTHLTATELKSLGLK